MVGKPKRPMLLDYTNPMTRKLVSYSILQHGQIYDLAAKLSLDYYSNPADKQADYLHFNDTRNGESIALPHLRDLFNNDELDDLTVIMRVRFHSLSLSTTSDNLFGQWNNIAGLNNSNAKRFFFGYNSEDGLLGAYYHQDSGTSHGLDASCYMTDRVWHTVAVRCTGMQSSSGNIEVFLDGEYKDEAGATGTRINDNSAGTTVRPEVMGGQNTTGTSTTGSPRFDLSWWGVWTRALSNTEILSMESEPFQMLRPHRPIVLRTPEVLEPWPILQEAPPDVQNALAAPLQNLQLQYCTISASRLNGVLQ